MEFNRLAIPMIDYAAPETFPLATAVTVPIINVIIATVLIIVIILTAVGCKYNSEFNYRTLTKLIV